MNAATPVVVTGLIVIGGRWASGKKMDMKPVVVITVFAFIMSILDDANAEFATKLGMLVMVGAMFVYLPTLVNKTVNKP